MMSEVLLINPRPGMKARKKRATKRAKTARKNMDNPRRRRTRRRRNPDGMSAPKRTRRRRSGQRRYAIAVSGRRRTPRFVRTNPRRRGYSARSILGIDLAGIGKDMIPLLVGALAGTAASKHLDADGTTGGANQPWTWKNYLLCILGSYAGGIVMSMVRPSWGSHARRCAIGGGVLTVLYNLITKEWAGSNETVSTMFGESGTRTYPASAGSQAWRFYTPGQVWRGMDGVSYQLGADNRWRALTSYSDVVDADRYGDIVAQDRYAQDVEPAMRDSWRNLRPPQTDPYYLQYQG